MFILAPLIFSLALASVAEEARGDFDRRLDEALRFPELTYDRNALYWLGLFSFRAAMIMSIDLIRSHCAILTEDQVSLIYGFFWELQQFPLHEQEAVVAASGATEGLRIDISQTLNDLFSRHSRIALSLSNAGHTRESRARATTEAMELAQQISLMTAVSRIATIFGRVDASPRWRAEMFSKVFNEILSVIERGIRISGDSEQANLEPSDRTEILFKKLNQEILSYRFPLPARLSSIKSDSPEDLLVLADFMIDKNIDSVTGRTVIVANQLSCALWNDPGTPEQQLMATLIVLSRQPDF